MWRTACRLDDVPPGGMKECALEGGTKVLVVNAGGEYFAYQALCPHETVPLEQGIHDGSILTCLEHLWQFDVRTGAPLGDAETGLTSFRVKNESGTLHVWTEDSANPKG